MESKGTSSWYREKTVCFLWYVMVVLRVIGMLEF